MNFDNYKFRCHALGHIMSAGKSTITDKQLAQITEFQGKEKLTDKQKQELNRLIQKRDNPELSATCKSYLIECYVSERFGREKDVYSIYMEKGTSAEEDSLTLYSIVKGDFFAKNTITISNSFLSGTPDVREPEKKHVRDIKSSWDLFTFFNARLGKLNPLYEWQLQGYMYIDNAETSDLVYCLVDTPDHLIHKQVNQLMWDMGAVTNESPEFLEAKAKLEHTLRFSDIPREERVHEKFVRRDESKIKQIPDRVAECREWLNELHHNLTVKTQTLQEVEF